MDISFSKLKELGFKPWDIVVTDDTAWLLESENDTPYDRDLSCWKPSYRVTVEWKENDNKTRNEWKCTAWFSDNSVKKNNIFRRVIVDNIATIEDIQRVMDICKIDKKII